jgi:asparagine synthase (glutamine-hydrolysing)
MRQAGQEKIRTVSVTFPGSILDESFYAKKASEHYGVSHTQYPLTEDEVINDIDKFFDAIDQPTIDGLNTYFVSKAAADLGLKVVISGLGGDELFGGYSTFSYIPQLEFIKKIPLSGTAMHLAAYAAKPFIKPKAFEYLRYSSGADASYKLFRGLFTSEELDHLGWKYIYTNNNSVIVSLPWRAKQSPSSLQQVSYLETTNYMSNQLLRDSDVFSMCHSLELRVPFVDDRLYSVVLKYLDSSYDKNKPKRMLTDAVGDLPEGIINRKKMGFTFPFDEWMRKGKLGKIVRDTITSANTNFRRKGVEELIKNFDKGKVHWSRLWALFVLSNFNE